MNTLCFACHCHCHPPWQAKQDYPQLGALALQLGGGLIGCASRLLAPNPTAAAIVSK